MNEIKSNSIKRSKNNSNNESRKEHKHTNISEEPLNIKAKTKKGNNHFDKNVFFINNQNPIDSINIINNSTNYKNIILNNMLTPNKKFIINNKTSSKTKKSIKIERNILYDNIQNNKNFRSLGQNKQKSLDQNNALKVIVNNNNEEDGNNINSNDIEAKYKLILYEKNNLINKLKNEIEYYKSYYHNINMNMNMNIIMPNNSSSNNTIEANSINRLSFSKNEKNIEGDNMRNRIKNIFSMPKKEIKFDNNNHLIKHNINEYNTIKTFDNKNNTDNNNSENAKDYARQIKNNFNTITINKKINYIENKLLLSNESLKSDIKISNNKDTNNTKSLNNNIFNRSNSNNIQKKGRKLKLGLHQKELTLDMNNKYSSIDGNRNSKNNSKSKKNIIYSMNSLTGSDNELDYINNNNYNNSRVNIKQKINGRFGTNKLYFNNISSSPSSLYKDKGNKILADINNSGELITVSDNNRKEFNYKENFDKLKKKMNILVNNIFDLIEVMNKKQ